MEEEGNAGAVSGQNQVHLGLTCVILACPAAESYRGAGGRKQQEMKHQQR